MSRLVERASICVLGGLAVDGGVESEVFVSGVVDDAFAAVGFDERVEADHAVAIATFFLGFDVTGVVVLHFVREFVFWGGVVLVFVLVDAVRQVECICGHDEEGNNDNEL